MERYITGGVIRSLREGKGMTQRQLAAQLSVSDKTVSKWETERGLPDISLVEPLAAALGVSVAELMRGQPVSNANRGGNMLKGKFYVCPVCGNCIWALGEGVYSCCGITLPPLEAEPEEGEHLFHVQQVENEWFVSLEHPMTKEHSITFFAFVSGDRVQLVRQYPEQNPETRFFLRGHGMLYACCNRHGLFSRRL